MIRGTLHWNRQQQQRDHDVDGSCSCVYLPPNCTAHIRAIEEQVLMVPLNHQEQQRQQQQPRQHHRKYYQERRRRKCIASHTMQINNGHSDNDDHDCLPWAIDLSASNTAPTIENSMRLMELSTAAAPAEAATIPATSAEASASSSWWAATGLCMNVAKWLLTSAANSITTTAAAATAATTRQLLHWEAEIYTTTSQHHPQQPRLLYVSNGIWSCVHNNIGGGHAGMHVHIEMSPAYDTSKSLYIPVEIHVSADTAGELHTKQLQKRQRRQNGSSSNDAVEIDNFTIHDFDNDDCDSDTTTQPSIAAQGDGHSASIRAEIALYHETIDANNSTTNHTNTKNSSSSSSTPQQQHLVSRTSVRINPHGGAYQVMVPTGPWSIDAHHPQTHSSSSSTTTSKYQYNASTNTTAVADSVHWWKDAVASIHIGLTTTPNSVFATTSVLETPTSIGADWWKRLVNEPQLLQQQQQQQQQQNVNYLQIEM
jgi:hypothetical protein